MGRISSITISGLPKFKYYLHNRVNEKGERQLYVRVYVRSRLVRRATGIYLKTADWNDKEQVVRSTNSQYRYYNDFLIRYHKTFESRALSFHGELTPPVVEKILSGEPCEDEATKKTSLIQYANNFNETRYKAGYQTYRTFENKKSCIKVFARWLRSQNKEKLCLDEVSVELIDNFIAFRRETLDNSSPQGINKSLVPIYKALEYARDNGLVEHHTIAPVISHYLPSKQVRHAKRKEEPIKYLTLDEVSKLIDYLRVCPRLRTCEFIEMWLFAYYSCGLRFSDILTLKWDHISNDYSTITKVQFKTGEIVTIPLCANAVFILKSWEKNNRIHSPYVFQLLEKDFNMSDERELNMRKNSVNKTINTSLSTVAQKIGLDSLTMHMARHSFAVQAINNGMDLKVLSKLLGHQITDTTERYYAKILDATRNKEYAAKTDFYELTPDLGFLNKR